MPNKDKLMCFHASDSDREAVNKVQLHLNQVYADNGVVRNANMSDAIKFAIHKAATNITEKENE